MRKTLLLSIFICFFLVTSTFAQERAVSGTVVSAEDGTALPGVSVAVKGTANGTITNVDGSYRLNASETSTLVFSFIGLESQEVLVGTQTNINVQLKASSTTLEELVVTGYDTQQRRTVIGAIASVTPKDFQGIPVVGIDQALQGQAAGVQVTQSSGTPGGGITVRIRGNTSISASNRPLFIVDGVPVEDGVLSQRDFGGQNDNALSTINPNDIASMQVLKDASTKAIYGSRGANGVVLITTKRGALNAKTTISLDVQRGIIDPVHTLELLDSKELLELQREAITNAGKNPDQQGLITGVTDAVNTNWIDEVLRRGVYQQYQLSVSGGNDKTRFYNSLSYRKEEGIQLNNVLRRYVGSFNIDHKVSKKLALGSNITLSRLENDRVKGDNFLDGVYSGAVKSLPYYQPYDEQGRLVGPGNIAYPAFPNFNPVAQALLPRFKSLTTKILGGIYAEYNFTDKLKFRTKVSADYNGVTEDQFESSQTAIGGYLPNNGYGVYNQGIYATIINTNLLTFNQTLQGKHHFSSLLGHEILQRVDRTFYVEGTQFPRDDFTYISGPDGSQLATVSQGGSYLVKSGLLSFFGEVKYDFEEKYLLSLTVREDGSSRFGKRKRFGFFPSIAAGWRLSEESFMKRLPVVSDLKLRASYGFTGNERIGDFQFLGTFSGSTYSGNSGLGPDKLGNPDLQWERTREINVGFDVSLWQGRIQVNFDAYNNLTNKLLFAQPLPTTTGFGGFQSNIGTVSNKGLELGLTTVNMNGEFSWTTTLNLSKNLNKVVDLVDTLPLFRGYSANNAGSTNVIMVGQPLGTFWGLKFLGVDPATGDALYEDTNGDGSITANDGQIIGNAQADLIGGITNRFSYKGFDLSVFFQFSYGNELLNFNNATLLDAGQDLNNNQVIAARKRWKKEGDITSIPRYEQGNSFNNYHSSRLIEDGSYLRLKNITLGYNLPKNLVNRAKLSSVRVYASATNLLTFTNYTGNDPEVSTLDGSTTAQGVDFFTLPQIRTIMAGITIGL